MTKKDFITVSSVINAARTSLGYATTNAGETKRCLDFLTEAMASKFAAINPRFEYDKFYKACGFN